MAYPIEATYEKNETPSRGLAVAGIFFFVKMILIIPHAIVLFVLGLAYQLLVWIGFWIAAITGAYPDWLHTFVVGFLRWQLRVSAWVAGLSDGYPPFSFDEGDYPVNVDAPINDKTNRLLAVLGILGFKWILYIPHMFVLFFLFIGAAFAAYVGYFIVAFTGKMPDGLQRFLGGVYRWNTRTQGWYAGVSDAYPPFSLD